MNRKILFGIFVLICGIVLTSCGEIKTQSSIVSKLGTLQMKSGDDYLLNTENGIVEITSNKINLDSYLKQKISVTGMFSGDILYVDKLEIEK